MNREGLTPRRAPADAADSASDAELIASGRKVVQAEAEGLHALAKALDQNFAQAVRWIFHCEGRVLIAGLGKSGIIARKMAGTFTSTGTPALFVHPVEALHGDLGIATPKDLLLLISRSGGNEELLALQGSLASLGVRSVALTAAPASRLAKRADLLLHTPVEKEACPLDLTPTTSTTTALALGDALAMSLLELRGFRREDFAVFHPSGSLGRGLRMTVRELMHGGDSMPRVPLGTTLRESLPVLASGRLGCLVVTDGEGKLAGFLSDGDLRRLLMRTDSPLELKVEECMSRTPVIVSADCLARVALRTMEENPSGPISQLVIVEDFRPVGIVHVHDILGVGLQA